MPNERAIERELIGSLVVEHADELLLEVVEVGSFAEDAAKILSEDEINERSQLLGSLEPLSRIPTNFGNQVRGEGKRKARRSEGSLLLRRGLHAGLFDRDILEAGEGEHH